MFIDEHLVVASAGSQAQHDAAVRDVVYCCDGVGQMHGVAQRVQHHSRPNLDPVSARGKGGHDCQRLQPGFGCDAVTNPDRVVADPLGSLRHLPVEFNPGPPPFGVYQDSSGGQKHAHTI